MAADPSIAMDQRLRAGQEYLDALCKLGFVPDVLCWAVAGRAANERMELLIVTTWADTIGPKAIYDLLFEAYDASATPKEIDPFIVTVFSPKSRLGAELIGMIRRTRIGKGPLGDPDAKPMLVLGMMDYATIPQWVIRFREPRSTRFDDKRHFAAFQRNIERLAA